MKDIALIITRTFGVEIDESYLCRMFNEAVGGQGIPHYVSIDEIKTVPHAPVSHPFVERLIGTTRRWTAPHR